MHSVCHVATWRMRNLQGRATVDCQLKLREQRQDGVSGGTLRIVVDGYNAPVTAGNFVDLVQRGFYNGMEIQRSDGFVVQTGDPGPPVRALLASLIGAYTSWIMLHHCPPSQVMHWLYHVLVMAVTSQAGVGHAVAACAAPLLACLRHGGGARPAYALHGMPAAGARAPSLHPHL